MAYNYDDIVRKFFEELKPLFINTLKKNFPLTYDEIMDIYSEVWLDIRKNILAGTVEKNTRWKSYIMKMGYFKANNIVSRRRPVNSFDDESFNKERFEDEYRKKYEEAKTIYDDPAVLSVLAAELSYIPNPCNNILKYYYFEGFSMAQIAEMMNYSGPRSVITTRKRCFDKLKARVKSACDRFGLIEK